MTPSATSSPSRSATWCALMPFGAICAHCMRTYVYCMRMCVHCMPIYCTRKCVYCVKNTYFLGVLCVQR